MRDRWPSSHGGWWVAAFAALYAILYTANAFLVDWLQASVVAGRLDIIFLPAFVRIAAVLIAGTAGLLGLFIGAFMVAVVHLQDPPLQAFFVATASALGAWASYAVTVWAVKPGVRNAQLTLALPILVVMAVFYCIFNAMIHALVWSLFGAVERLSIVQLAQMMFGDLLGVIAMFFITRWTIRFLRVMRPVTT